MEKLWRGKGEEIGEGNGAVWGLPLEKGGRLRRPFPSAVPPIVLPSPLKYSVLIFRNLLPVQCHLVNNPLAITATALLTPLDSPSQSTFDAIRAGCALADRGLIPESSLLPPDYSPRAAGDYLTNPTLDKSIRLALRVALQALDRAGWLRTDFLRDSRTHLYVGTSKGPVLTALAAAQLLRERGPLPAFMARQLTLGPAACATLLAEALGLVGPVHTSIAACSSGLHALHRAAAALAHGEADRALVVAADASAHPLFEASFSRLGVLAPPDPDGHRRCRPFDPSGNGFFLTETAAAVTLQRFADVTAFSRETVPITLEATLIAADSTHLVAIDEHTASLRHALAQVAAFTPQAFSFLHAHATGTPHDAHELAAIQAVFPHASLDPAPPRPLGPLVFSHKRYLGHSLGAAGLVSLVLSTLCHQHRMTLAGTPLPAAARSLTISQGFGGHIALAALRAGDTF